jgi:4-hydroxybenzoate polyprenyltransferase
MATERLITNRVPDMVTLLHCFVFGSTLFVYNVHFLIRHSSPVISDRSAWSKNHKFWHYFFLIGGAITSASILLFLSIKIFFACLLLGVLSFTYSLPLLPFSKKKRLKDFGWLKLLVLASVWTIVTSILPILYWEKAISDYPFEVLIRFVFLLTLCIAFDIRDMQTDLEAQIYTLPNRIGLKNSYLLMNGTIIVFAILSLVQYLRYPSPVRLTGELCTAIAMKLVIDFTKKRPSDKAYLGLVDGTMLLYAILVTGG